MSLLEIYGCDFFEGSVTEPRRTFVTDLVTDLRNKTRWLVTHPSLHTPWLVACPSLNTPIHAQTLSDFPWVSADQTFAEHAFAEESTCREFVTQVKS